MPNLWGSVVVLVKGIGDESYGILVLNAPATRPPTNACPISYVIRVRLSIDTSNVALCLSILFPDFRKTYKRSRKPRLDFVLSVCDLATMSTMFSKSRARRRRTAAYKLERAGVQEGAMLQEFLKKAPVR